MTTVETRTTRPPAKELARCPTCGSEMPADFRFCGQCGRALGATFAPVAGNGVTIAFVDVTGFSQFASRRAQEEVRDVIRIFHWLVREQVAAHGGFEVKQLGDGFMLAFSDPRRALACAIEIVRVTAPKDDGTGLPAAVRVCAGLNSGDAIREGDDFFGHTVNVASRLMSRAKGGQVLLSDATRQAIGDVEGVRFVDLGPRRLRGIRGRVRVFEASWR